MEQITKEQAIKLAEERVLEKLDSNSIVKFQLFQNRLAMDFSKFQEAVEKELGRSVFTHEFVYIDNLRKEFLGEESAPTFEEIINLIPQKKLILLEI